MLIDFHTHTCEKRQHPAIRNLTFAEAEKFFSSDDSGTVSVGIHPWTVENNAERELALLKEWARDNRLVAIGECGLDKYSKTALDEQTIVFTKQIELSEEIHKPLIIHCVGCFNELFALKKTLNPKQLWVIHGFRGKPQLARQALQNGCALSFGEHFHTDSVRLTPTDRLFIETDESRTALETIYRQIAEIKCINIDELTAGEIFLKKAQNKAPEPR